MFIIRDKIGRYLKLTFDNKITFTFNKSLADGFPNEREANDFIKKSFKKKKQKNYKSIYCNDIFVSDIKSYQSGHFRESINKYEKSIEGFNEVINTYLSPEIEKYTQELQKYDGMILDIRHWLRDEDTKLNACQGYQVTKKLQDIERKRANCKKELQRVAMLRGAVKKACDESKTFEYEKYKNRQIEDVREFLFAE